MLLLLKLYRVEDHAAPMTKRRRRLGDYGEESVERLHRVVNLRRRQQAAARPWERRRSKTLDERRVGAYPGVESSREASESCRRRVYSDATRQTKREAARALDEVVAEKRRRAVAGAGAG